MPLPTMTMPKILDDTTILSGGLVLRTPNKKLRPGFVREAQNWYAAIQGGYTRVEGYERFDGETVPSASIYQPLQFSSPISPSPSPDVIGIRGSTSGASAYIVQYDVAHSLIYVTLTSGNFVIGESIKYFDAAGNESLPSTAVTVT